MTLKYVLNGPLTGPSGTMWKTLVAQFNKKYAPTKVELVPEGQSQLEATELTSVKSANPPDMIYWPVGPGYGQSTAVSQGLLANLLPLYKQQGWLKLLPSAMNIEEIKGGLYNVDGTLGAQPYVFYNENLFNKYGIKAPSTVGQLTAIGSKLKKDGVGTPMAFGAGDQWPAVHLMSILTERTLSLKTYNNLLFSWEPSTKNPTSWTSPAVVKAFTILQDWVKAGLIPASANALSNDEAVTLFEQGKSPMVSCPIGCFSPAVIKQYIGDRFKVGMFQYPQVVPDIPQYQNIATANSEFSVPEAAWKKHQAAITEFIKFYMSLGARRVLTKAGNVPDDTQGISSKFISANAGAFNVEVLNWMSKYGTEQNLDGFLSAPLRTAVGQQAQKIISGSTSPMAACRVLQQLAQNEHSGKGASES